MTTNRGSSSSGMVVARISLVELLEPSPMQQARLLHPHTAVATTGWDLTCLEVYLTTAAAATSGIIASEVGNLYKSWALPTGRAKWLVCTDK